MSVDFSRNHFCFDVGQARGSDIAQNLHIISLKKKKKAKTEELCCKRKKKKITVDIYFLSFLVYKGHFSLSFQKSELKLFYLLLWEML